MIFEDVFPFNFTRSNQSSLFLPPSAQISRSEALACEWQAVYSAVGEVSRRL